MASPSGARRVIPAVTGFLCALALGAATYLPMSDADLVRASKVVVHASGWTVSSELYLVEGLR